MEKLGSLLKLSLNWDSYGGLPPSLLSVQMAHKIIRSSDCVFPQIVPISNGGVQLEWHRRQIHFEIEITSDGRLSAYYNDPDGEWERDLLFDELIGFMKQTKRLK